MRILALNDDNHATCFTREDGVRYYNSASLIRELSDPHEEKYEVKGFVIFDEIEGYNDEEVQLMFECVESVQDVNEKVYNSELTFKDAFNILWLASSEYWY